MFKLPVADRQSAAEEGLFSAAWVGNIHSLFPDSCTKILSLVNGE